MKSKKTHSSGFTLIEVVMSIIIAGILATVAIRSTISITESGRTEITKTEMTDLAHAIVGNENLQNNNIRNDFGYVGDVGAMPPNLTALVTNPGGYSTWDGPYIQNRFAQTSSDYAQDAWGVNYAYSGVDIISNGSGSSIVHKIGESTSDFLLNKVTGNIYDADGSPPGTTFKDSITILLTFPNGSGGLLTKGISPDYGGYFEFDSIPIGNQDLQIVYEPTADTLNRFVSLNPKSTAYSTYLFPTNYWVGSSGSGGSGGGSGSGLIYVNGTGQTTGGSCNDIRFDVQNNTTSDITITSVTPTWDSPTSYYKELKIAGDEVFDNSNPRNGTGTIVNFSGITISAGETITIKMEEFKTNSTGGPNANMSNSEITFTFSDGSVITFNTGSC